MAEYKGTTMVFLRGFLRRQGEPQEQALLAQLTEQERDVYESSQSMSWVPVEAAAAVLDKAARVAFPGDPRCLQKLGHAQAHDHLTGIYKILLRVTTVPFVIGQSAKLWTTYHNQGRARVEREPDQNRGILVVEGYPELPEPIRTMSSGYIRGTLELTRVKHIAVHEDFSRPAAWRWEVSWS